ncbi:MAG: DUF1990 family protein [Microbacteriaceae bacterium]|nr:DUF1990 family protein [Microbacteriaceae bacterium]
MSGEAESHRRSTHIDRGAVYGAVGASASPDLLRFPPTGATPFEHERKLGSGVDRFLIASNMLMTWGAQRAAGIDVRDVEQADHEHYSGVTFNSAGTPEKAPELEIRYGSDGEPFLTAGTTAVLHWPGRGVVRNVRVVFVADEPRRAGFALGTVDDSGVVGETAYYVDHRSDDTVWAIARGFYRAPESGIFGLRGKAAIRLAERTAIQQIESLAPGVAPKRESEIG